MGQPYEKDGHRRFKFLEIFDVDVDVKVSLFLNNGAKSKSKYLNMLGPEKESAEGRRWIPARSGPFGITLGCWS